ncbi:hypothetical protein BRADI_3g25665v3 [Brachypodium distachyon]|uniref:Uncharacterized protein n=1 Tax=Brachypodium distachyon TaxID=15368 RepID=A0A2K2CZ84_BRADI|nr:hypothetical protein BRADI_3g25665v3 [Brachypodium distachyon]
MPGFKLVISGVFPWVRVSCCSSTSCRRQRESSIVSRLVELQLNLAYLEERVLDALLAEQAVTFVKMAEKEAVLKASVATAMAEEAVRAAQELIEASTARVSLSSKAA